MADVSTDLPHLKHAAVQQPRLAVKAGDESVVGLNHQVLEDFAAVSSDCFWEMDAKLNYTYVSDRFKDITGIPKNFVLGVSNDELGIQTDDKHVANECGNLLNEHKPFRNFVFSYMHPDGRDIDISMSGNPILDRSGVFSGYRGTAKLVGSQSNVLNADGQVQAAYRRAGRVAGLGYWEWDEVADRCTFCSEELARILGVSVKEYLQSTTSGSGDLSWVHPDDLARYSAAEELFRKDNAGFEIEYRIMCADGSITDVYEAVAPIVDSEGIVSHSFGFVKDISQTTQAAAALEARVIQRTEELQLTNNELRESRSRLRDATKIAKLGYFKWDTVKNKGIYADAEFSNILGAPVLECMTESLDQYMARIHSNDIEIVRASYASSNADKIPIDVEYRIIRSNGDIRHVHERSTQKEDENGTVVQTFGTLQDITERKVAGEELALVEERLHELGANAREVLYVLSADWQKVFYVNEAYEDVWGYSRQAVIDNPRLWIDSLHPDDRDMIVTEIGEKSGGGDSGPDFSDCRIIDADGEVRWLSNRMYPIRDDNEVIVRYAGVAEDITDRKAATDALHQVQKMDAVGQLTGGVAHDFNNLLAVILGNSALLQGRLAQDDESLLQDIIAAGTRGAELTKSLLAFSRLQPLQPTPTNIVNLVAGMEGLLQRTLGATILVKITSSCNDATALVDPGLLENAILNLSLNARDAMPDGGRLVIRVRKSKQRELNRPGTEREFSNRRLEIVVRDNGAGMSAAVLSRSLEPFFTTKVSGQGSGLGLPMVYGFVKQSHGDLVIDSKPGEGTVVTICLPHVYGDGD